MKLPADHNELRQLFDALVDNRLDEASTQRLRQSLRNDAQARAFFCEFMALNSQLGLLFAQPLTVPNFTIQGTEIQPANPAVLPLATNSAHTSLSFLRSRFRVTSRPALVATLLFAAVLYGSFMLIAWNLRPDKAPSFASGDNASVAFVCNTADVEWSKLTSSKSTESSIRPGELLKIESGTIELELKAGTKLVVEGPADWSVSGKNSVSLRSGKLLARVPEKAIGFMVETPAAKIVDLGTEFGVQVDAEGQTDVEVISGKVDVKYDSSAKLDGSHQTVRMTPGIARRFSNRVEGDGVAVTPIASWVNKATIGKSLAKTHRELPAETQYSAAVLADQPLGYWRFSDNGNPQATDVSGHERHGTYFGFVSTTSPGIDPRTNDRCIQFLGRKFHAEVKIDDVELPPAFTIELWARSATPDWNAHGWLMACADPHGLLVHPGKNHRLDFYVVDSSGLPKLVAYFTPESISDRFHHYVCAFDSSTDHGWLYFDGALVGERKDVLNEKPRTEVVKRNFHVGICPSPSPSYGFGEGWIDELAIYSQVLSAETVRHHFTIGNISEVKTDSQVVHPTN